MTESADREDLTFAPDDRAVSVLLVRDADDYRAMHPMIEVRAGEERTLFEVGGWQEERPIARILALAGFVGGGGGGAEARPAPEVTPVVPLRGFTLADPSRAGDVQMMIRRALSGQLGGFHPVVAGQVGFHAAVWAFEYVWDAAGCPPLRIFHPELVAGPEAEETSAGAIAPAAERNTTLRTVRTLSGQTPKAEETA